MSEVFTTRRATLDDIDALVQLRLKLFRETGEIHSDEAPLELVEITRQYLHDNISTNRFLV
ncbi:MAG TPA: hypothetical protein VEL31_11540 [Ktedonobacteraceae bacterium]|nr:hypothetical protein [Ktedonobacteraceae bacterium]